MAVYSFRAECLNDLEQLKKLLTTKGTPATSRYEEVDRVMPDIRVELQTDCNLYDLQELIRSIPDSSVMIQTLKATPLAQNDLKRDRSKR